MRVTKREAGNKICPLNTNTMEACFCYADACMMWRWAYDGVDISQDEKRGFCGMAGAP